MKRLHLNRLLLTFTLMPLAAPAFAEEAGPFFSLHNPELVVAIGFLVFVGILLYVKLPGRAGKMLDARAEGIAKQLAEARALREEAKALLASYEAKSREVAAQSARIVAQAKDEAQAAATQARADLAKAIERRIAAAGEKIASAEAGAIRSVREQAVSMAVSVAGEILARQSTAASAKSSIDAAIEQVGARLN